MLESVVQLGAIMYCFGHKLVLSVCGHAWPISAVPCLSDDWGKHFDLELLCRAYGEDFLYDEMHFITAIGQLMAERVHIDDLQHMLR